MFSAVAKSCLIVLLLFSACRAEPVVTSVPPPLADTFTEGLGRWVVEQMPGGHCTASEGVLRIDDERGCTVWWREKLRAPIKISYEATVRSDGRVSDLNCFWMATDLAHPDGIFYAGHPRTGEFSTYDKLRTYYVGYGGNNNTTTRFRRYDGLGGRPLLPQHDLSDKSVLLAADHAYRIEIVVREGITTFSRDGEVVFELKDPQPLTEGWFGFRTVKSKIEVRDFRVEQL